MVVWGGVFVFVVVVVVRGMSKSHKLGGTHIDAVLPTAVHHMYINTPLFLLPCRTRPCRR